MGVFNPAPVTTAAEVVPTTTVAPAPPAPPPHSIVDVELARKSAAEEATAAATARSMEIVRWCNVLGKPDLAEGFLKRNLSVEQVRNELLDVTASAGFEIDTHRPVTHRTYLSIDAIYAQRRQAVADAKKQRIA